MASLLKKALQQAYKQLEKTATESVTYNSLVIPAIIKTVENEVDAIRFPTSENPQGFIHAEILESYFSTPPKVGEYLAYDNRRWLIEVIEYHASPNNTYTLICSGDKVSA